MFLTTEQLQKRIETSAEIIEYSIPDNFGKFSYDLRVSEVLIETEDGKTKKETNYTLSAGATVFVATKEVLNMPLDLIGIVTQKNSVIRKGLKIDAPIYHPGHHTRMFLRVTNISQDDIEIHENYQIASIMFGRLSEEVEAYKGHFVDEFDFMVVANYPNDIPKVKKVDKKMKSLENIEKNIYERVILIVSIFIGVFSLINLNTQFVSTDLLTMLIYNLISIGGIGIFVSFIGIIMDNQNKSKWWILLISIVLIILGFSLMKK